MPGGCGLLGVRSAAKSLTRWGRGEGVRECSCYSAPARGGERLSLACLRKVCVCWGELTFIS